MSVSIEALAMAGANYLDYAMEAKERETPPAHLLAEEEEERQEIKDEVKISRNMPAKLRSFSHPECSNIFGSPIRKGSVPRKNGKPKEVARSVTNKKSNKSLGPMVSIAGC